MSASRKRKADTLEMEDEGKKKQKINLIEDYEPSLTDLSYDTTLHVLDFLGAQGFLNLASTCSKLKSIVDSRLQSHVKKIFPVGFDHLLDPANRFNTVAAIQRAAQIESAFGYRIKILALEPATIEFAEDNYVSRRQFGERRDCQLFELATWDDHKILRLSPNHRKCTIVCSETGRNLCAVDVKSYVTHFASSRTCNNLKKKINSLM